MNELSFSLLLKKVRTDLNMSQKDLADKLNVCFATVNRWENNQNKPSKLARIQFESFRKEMIQKADQALEKEFEGWDRLADEVLLDCEKGTSI
jgi:transcriptional regulator with XRE-family HTH domain